MMACSTTKTGYCTCFAAAYTSAPKLAIMDTASLAVSILRYSNNWIIAT